MRHLLDRAIGIGLRIGWPTSRWSRRARCSATMMSARGSSGSLTRPNGEVAIWAPGRGHSPLPDLCGVIASIDSAGSLRSCSTLLIVLPAMRLPDMGLRGTLKAFRLAGVLPRLSLSRDCRWRDVAVTRPSSLSISSPRSTFPTPVRPVLPAPSGCRR